MSPRDLVLTVNAGSSSLRLAAFARDKALTPLGARRYETAGGAQADILLEFLQPFAGSAVASVAHRVVHGGAALAAPCVVDGLVEAEIERLGALAPLHNPPALAWIRLCRELLGAAVPQVAVFDTGFFANLPAASRHYPIPRSLADKHGARRYGFHGIAHQAMWRRWRELRPDIEGGGRVISFQLGSGCSAAAVERGAPKDTSMGFTPLEGLVMATRAGDLDPGLIAYLQRREGLDAEATERLLNGECGLRGVAGEADMRRLLERGDAEAKLAVELYCHRARKYLGAYLALLGGADAVLFGGGVGENAPAIRARILENMEWAGIVLDDTANRAPGAGSRIGAAGAKVDVRVIAVDEARILAEEGLRHIAQM